MKIVHVERTQNGNYFIMDASRKEAGYAPASTVPSEREVRVNLRNHGFTEEAIENSLVELRETGQVTLRG